MNVFETPLVNTSVITLTVIMYVVVGTVTIWLTTVHVKTLTNAVLCTPVSTGVGTVQIPLEAFTVLVLPDML